MAMAMRLPSIARAVTEVASAPVGLRRLFCSNASKFSFLSPQAESKTPVRPQAEPSTNLFVSEKSEMASPSSSFWNIASRQAMKSGMFLAKFYCFLHVTTNYLGFMAYAYGPSMIPTLHPSGNILLAERISKRYQKPNRGDIVVIRSPENPNKTPIKRVVGIEGDCISFVVDPAKSNKSQTVVVPKGHVFVQGDYTHNSRDSRTFGPVPYGLIQGRVLWRVWPFQDFGPLGPTPT